MDPPPAPPELRFRILGPLEVTRGGDALALGGPRQKAVLACLPVHANEVVPIDALADGIWEGRPPDSATGTIRTYVSHLRRVVEAGPAGGNGHVLLTTPPGYRLRVEPGQLDSDEFERLLEQARRARADGAPELALGHLNQALGLWRGPALADFAAESFAHAEAARLDGRRLAALEERIEAQLALGLHAELVAELEQRATDHPLRERLWGQLMLALYRSGRQAEALGAYQRTRAMLAEELGIDPGPALQRLQRAILQQDPALDWHPPSQPRSPALADPPAPESAPARRPGRSSSAASGSCATWPSCSGGPPTGRAAWCCWAARPGSARPAPPRSWPPSPGAEGCGSSGAAATRATAPPYWLWAEVLRSSVAGRDPEALAAALGGAAAEISQFVPELRERLPAPPPAAPLDPEAARFRLFEVVADLLRRAAAARPTLLVLDDLHWADKPSLMLLQFLTRQLRDAPVLVVGAYRDAEVGRRHPLNDVLASLSRERVTSRVTLQGLEAPEVARFIEAATGVPPGPLAAAVHARTEGNPFFVRELVRLLEAEGRLDAAEELGWSGVPSTVREVVGRARNRLSGGADHLLTHAAVIGRDFDAELLGRLLGAPDDQLVEVLEEVLASGLVAEDPGQVGGYRFSHDLVREAVYGELSTIRRAAMHRQIGQAIEDLRAACLDRHYAALARHFLLAARGGHDLPRAVDYAMLAADQATAALAYEEAIGHCERALRALRLAAPADHATACRLLLRLGDGRWRAGEVARARDTFLEAAALARSLEEPELLARAVIGFKGELFRDWHTTNGAVLQQLVELLEEALAAIGPGDGPLRVRLLGHLAEALCYRLLAGVPRPSGGG
jgi:DNA-binding SARP family transcriptional activator